jgi:hypothetical protein
MDGVGEVAAFGVPHDRWGRAWPAPSCEPRERRIPEPCTPATLLVLSANCKGIVMRPGALRAAPRRPPPGSGRFGPAHRSVTELEDDIRRWINEWNKNPKPFIWTKTADDILETLAPYSPKNCRLRTLVAPRRDDRH